MKITLQTIRDSKTFDDLKPAIIFVCDNLNELSWGEFNAFRRTIENQAEKIGVSLPELTDYVVGYQIEGRK